MPRVCALADFSLASVSEDEAEAFARAIVAAAEEEEPGTLVYAWFRDANDPTHWFALEIYEDEEAAKRHLRGPRMKEVRRGAPTPEGKGSVLVPIASKGLPRSVTTIE
jgi:quinol monooxygenase YgiN